LQGVDVEVIDLRTISPLDWPTVLTSIKKTGRLLVAHEAVTDFGVGAEIAARAARDGFWSLDVPIRRVGAPYAPAPYAQSLEAEWAVSVDQIVGEASAMAAE
jgi:2-oxoisovalerate dehydrogenase E1 component